MTVDIIFYHAIVVTMADPIGCGIVPDGAVAVKKDRIIAVGETKKVLKQYSAHRYLECSHKLLMPGLIDAHMHSGVSIYKGYAQDTERWMNDCVFILKGALDLNARKAGSMLMIAEGIKAGTTTMVDCNEEMLFFAENHVKSGIRAQLSHTVHGLPLRSLEIEPDQLYPLDQTTEEESLENAEKLICRYHLSHGGRITCGLSPLGLDRVSEEGIRRIGAISEKEHLRIYLHLACGLREIHQMEMRYAKRSIPFLNELGLINKYLCSIHLSVAKKDELKLLAKKNSSMVLCSGSEAIVDGNIPPAVEFGRYGGKIAIGTDQTSGGNTSNVFYEMKIGALLNKCKFRNPEIFQAWKMLRMATIDGAKVIGMETEIGSLEPGKKADIIMLDLEHPHMTPMLCQPISNIIPNLVYAANGSEVELSMVDGKILMEDRELLTINEKDVIKDGYTESMKLLEAAGKQLINKNKAIKLLLKENKL